MRLAPSCLAALLLAAALAAPSAPAASGFPNADAVRAQGRAELAFDTAALEGMFEGRFHFIDREEAPGDFTLALRPDGPGRWTGTVRDAGGPQAKVVATYDGVVFQMSKQYPKNRPEGYSEWVLYVGTLKLDPASGARFIVGVWSIPGNLAWGVFEIEITG